MIIFLHGKDTYRMREKLKEIIDEYKKVRKSGINLNFFDCQKEDIFRDLKDDLRQTSIFEEKKLAVVSDPFSNAHFGENFLKEAESFLKSEDLTIFYQEGEINKNSALLNFLEKNAKTQEFNSLTGLKLKNWVIERLGGQKIEQEAIDVLLRYIGSDLWRMNNEIQKLKDYKKGEVIKKEDVGLQVKPFIEIDIFKTIDAIAQKKKDSALRLLHKHLENGESPIYLISMVNYQFRNLLIIKDFIEKFKPYGVILKKSGLHPFVVKKSYFQCGQFSFGELKKIYHKIFTIDLSVKTGKIDPRAGLELLIAEI